jgi:hypothetical protein
MPIDPRISLGIQQLQLTDPLAQYGQEQNILAAQAQRKTARTQNELAQAQLGQANMAIKEAQEAQDYVAQVMAEAKKNGAATDDPMDAAMQMLQHPNPKVRAAGQNLFDANEKVLAYQQDKLFANRTAPQPLTATALPPAAGAQSVPVPNDESYNAWLKAKTDLPYRDWLNTQTNALAPAAAPAAPTNALAAAPAEAAPAAPTNALAAPSRADQILEKINDLRTRYPYSPKAKEEIAFLTKQYEEASKAYTVAPGGALVVGGKEVYKAKEKPLTPTDLVRNYEYAKTPEGGNFKGTFAEFKAISTPKTTVSYGPQEKEEKKEYGKLLVDDFKGVKAQATVAAKSLPAIESNLATLDKGFDTGFGTETIAAGARVLGALGVEKAEDFATNAQTFLASANAAVLQRQLEQKGPQTESDAKRITATGAQLGNTKDANRFILNVAKAQLQRDIEQRAFYAKWRDKNKTLEGAEDAWFAGPGSKSLFESPVLKKYATSAADQIPGQRDPATAAPSNSVTLPDGRVKTFPNAEAANQFKKAAGL